MTQEPAVTHERFTHRRDGFTIGDTLSEAIRGLPGRPGRMIIAVTTVALGVGALVATIGFAQTGAHQLQTRFDAYASTRVIAAPTQDPLDSHDLAVIPWDADQRATRINGVVAAGLIAPIELHGMAIKSVPLNDPEALPAATPLLLAVTPGMFEVAGATLSQGTPFNTFHHENTEPVAVLGAHAAQALGITRVDNAPAIFLGDAAFTVVGILDTALAHAELLDAVIIPTSTARQQLGLQLAGSLEVEISLGAGDLVATQLPTMLNPNNPTGYTITKPAPDSVIRTQLSADVDTVFLAVGLIALLIGTLTNAAVTSLSVMERQGEIGLRRALGATPTMIAAQFLTECGITGLLGGLIGAAAGILTLVAVCATNNWTAILDLRLTAAATATGLAAGVLSGILPAHTAARTEPATTLQAGT